MKKIRMGMFEYQTIGTILLLLVGLSNCFGPYNTTGQRQEGKRNVHIVPHTHDDSGWLKTVDQYYFGSSQDIQLAGVQYILDTVVAALAANPDRNFIYAEMSFFSMWWGEQTTATRNLVKQLIKNGQLDFVNGGYVQNDEAASHYVAMIDQTTVGHQFLNSTFGVTPRIGWQIDPFGHSATQASLMSGILGFDALYFGRADIQDMKLRKERKQMELLWRGAKSYGAQADVFTGNFESGNYGPPPGFNWDPQSKDQPIMDNFEEQNYQQRVDDFVDACNKIFDVTYGDDIMIPFGTDFTYMNAFQWYKNLDKLIHYANLDGRLNLFYSTPAIYTDVKNAYNTSWPLKTDDFFPYSDCDRTCYWSGYFTSRPTSKGYIRSSTAFLQAARQLDVLGAAASRGLTKAAAAQARAESASSSLDKLEKAVALTQHHDAITGTEKQEVSRDYHKRLYAGMEEASASFRKNLASLISSTAAATKQTDGILSMAAAAAQFQMETTILADLSHTGDRLGACGYLNASVCHPTVEMSRAGHNILVAVYNPLAWPRSEGVRVPVNTSFSANWTVTDASGRPVEAQLMDVSDATLRLQQIMLEWDFLDKLTAAATQEIAFIASVPPLGYTTFVLSPANASGFSSGNGAKAAVRSVSREWHAGINLADNSSEPGDMVRLSSGPLDLTVSTLTGRLLALRNAGQDLSAYFDAEMAWYNSSDKQGAQPNMTTPQDQASGAYMFRPNGLITSTSPVVVQIVEGPVLTEVRQEFIYPWATLNTRLWKGAEHIEVEWTAGPIPFLDGLGKELIVRYTSNVSSGSEFYTDANGREMQKRIKDYRPTWPLEVKEPVAGNYYPLTAAMYIQDRKGAQLALVTDRAQGGASLKSGEMEVMVHRRTLLDDERGVGEPINETMCGDYKSKCTGLIARGCHFITLQGSSSSASYRRTLQQRVNDPFILSFGRAATSGQQQSDSYSIGDQGDGLLGALAPAEHSFLADPAGLPKSVHLLTLKDNGDGRVLLRLAHLYEVDEDSGEDKIVSVNLNKLFKGLTFTAAEEVTLSAGQALSKVNRLAWRPGKSLSVEDNLPTNPPPVSYALRKGLSCQGGCTGALSVELQPMEIRTFLLDPLLSDTQA